MIRKLKSILLAFSVGISLMVPALAATTAFAVSQGDLNNAACGGTSGDLGGGNIKNCDVKQSDFNKYATAIVNLLSVVVGFVAVVMMIIGGFRYITSGGSSDKVSGAKNTILYGIIGLIIVALAQVIVQFVLHKAASG